MDLERFKKKKMIMLAKSQSLPPTFDELARIKDEEEDRKAAEMLKKINKEREKSDDFQKMQEHRH